MYINSRHNCSYIPISIIYLLLLAVLLIDQGVESGGWSSSSSNVNNEELYKLLDVPKTANTKEIRVAFKKLALEKHPDKNPDDPGANDLFMKINRAYEILKDDETRKKYDMYGEEGLKDDQQGRGNHYQSWNFYQQNFGIYDQDPEVITLSRSEFSNKAKIYSFKNIIGESFLKKTGTSTRPLYLTIPIAIPIPYCH
jgi:DnaJ-class molecular chaperone